MWNLIVLGLISCFSDISSEMVYPLIPLYLTAAFGATPAMIGIVEGFAESVAGLLKVFSGYLSDRFQQKKALAFGGYAAGVLYKIALLFAGSWTGILGARVIDRFGKGVRTAPRDVMVAESAGESGMGRAFGIHKMVRRVGSDGYRTVFAVSIIPISFSLLLFFLIHEKKGRHEVAPRERFWRNISRLDGRFKLYLTVTFLFTLGNSSNSFLLLRASDIGFDDSDMILLYFLYNVIACALAIPCGKLSDKIGRKRVLVVGYLTFSLVYFGFALCKTKLLMALIFVIYGGYTAMTAGVERAFIAESAPPQLKGTMLGLHSMLAGIALLPASVIAGLLWDGIGAAAPFIFGGGLSLLSAVILVLKLGDAAGMLKD